MLIYHVRRTVLAFPLARTTFERGNSGWLLIAVIAADSLLAAGAWYFAGFIIGN
ncbi:hypothetical protein ACMYR2_3544 [Nitrobacter sp. TKz-YC01]